MKNNETRAKEIFAQYPTKEEVHFSSDGTPFFSKSDCGNHAKTLEDKSIDTHYKPSAPETLADDDTDDYEDFGDNTNANAERAKAYKAAADKDAADKARADMAKAYKAEADKIKAEKAAAAEKEAADKAAAEQTN